MQQPTTGYPAASWQDVFPASGDRVDATKDNLVAGVSIVSHHKSDRWAAVLAVDVLHERVQIKYYNQPQD